MSSATYELIKQAIINRQQVVATYHGHIREMCPHTLGWKNGKEQALFYQFGGTSSTGIGPVGTRNNWRCIPLAGLSNVTLRDGDWHTAPNHSRPSTCVGKIDVEVSY